MLEFIMLQHGGSDEAPLKIGVDPVRRSASFDYPSLRLLVNQTDREWLASSECGRDALAVGLIRTSGWHQVDCSFAYDRARPSTTCVIESSWRGL